MPGQATPRNALALVVIALTAALVMRAWLQVELLKRGIHRHVAEDISYLVTIPVLLLLTIPIWRSAFAFIAQQYRRSSLTIALVLTAIALGLAMRTAFWSAVFAMVSFGWLPVSSGGSNIQLQVLLQCDPVHYILLGLLVSAILIPFTEEIIHRGYIYRALLRFGVPVAVVSSALAFAVFHKFGTWPVAFIAGVVFAIQYQRTGSLWASTVAHATFNAVSQFDSRCFRARWNPAVEELPVTGVGAISLIVFLVAAALIVWLIWKKTPGASMRPGP